MYKWIHEYTDYDDHKREETFYFNFNKAELLDLEWRTPGGIEQYMKTIMSLRDGQKLADMFKMLIEKSYGIKGPDGREFIKSDEILNHFKFTEAYADLYMLLATDSDAASAFVNGIFPKAAIEEAKKQHEMAEKAGISLVDNTPKPIATAPVQPVVPMVEGQQVFEHPVEATQPRQ